MDTSVFVILGRATPDGGTDGPVALVRESGDGLVIGDRTADSRCRASVTDALGTIVAFVTRGFTGVTPGLDRAITTDDARDGRVTSRSEREIAPEGTGFGVTHEDVVTNGKRSLDVRLPPDGEFGRVTDLGWVSDLWGHILEVDDLLLTRRVIRHVRLTNASEDGTARPVRLNRVERLSGITVEGVFKRWLEGLNRVKRLGKAVFIRLTQDAHTGLARDIRTGSSRDRPISTDGDTTGLRRRMWLISIECVTLVSEVGVRRRNTLALRDTVEQLHHAVVDTVKQGWREQEPLGSDSGVFEMRISDRGDRVSCDLDLEFLIGANRDSVGVRLPTSPLGVERLC